jgi:ABC-type multidrug transport system fused ATPase/permease subunit
MVPPNVVAVLATAAVALTVRFVASKRGAPESSDPASNGNPEEEEEEEEEEEDAAAAAQQQFGKKRDFVVEPTTITWHNITCVLLDKANKVSKVLLQSVNGEAKAGRLLAIMGPSGSGKTTFLNVLAGQLPASARLRINGSIMINGHPFSSMKHRLAYVRQEDLFFSQLTVRETLSLAAELQLPRTWKSKAKDRYVDELLYRLGLVGAIPWIIAIMWITNCCSLSLYACVLLCNINFGLCQAERFPLVNFATTAS